MTENADSVTTYRQGDFPTENDAKSYADLWNEHQPWGNARYAPEQDGSRWRLRVTLVPAQDDSSGGGQDG